jgi:hypothetical protein
MAEQHPQAEKTHTAPTARIHIDRERYDAPTPTTGAALYILGKVPAHHELFREVGGDREDEPVADSDKPIHLKQDDHFYSAREFEIIVNARPKKVAKRGLSFDEVVQLAFPGAHGPEVRFTVTYEKGPRKNPEGILDEGQSVRIREEMEFHVKKTNRS